MPTHVHFVIVIGGSRLGGFMRDFKKYVAQKIARDFGTNSGAIWMHRYDRVVIESMDLLKTKIEYIHRNPVKARLVDVTEEYKWSSAGAYTGDNSGIVSVETEIG
jgi:hypothetical protein